MINLRVIIAEIEVLRKAAKYTVFDHTRNRDILKELETQPVFVQVNCYNSKWIQRVNRMERSRLLTLLWYINRQEKRT